MAKRGGPDQRPSEDGEAVFIQRLSPERGCRRGEKLWITESFPVREEWPVVQSSQHHGTGSTKKPMLPRQNRAEDHWGGRKKIPDSPFKLFGRRSEAGVVVAEQLLIVRVRLRDRSSALMDWPDWLERAVLVQRVPLSPSLALLACLGEPAHDSTQPADHCRNNPSAQGGRGRTGVPAPESGEHTLSQSPAPNHAAGINTVKRVQSASAGPMQGAPPPTPALPAAWPGCR